MPNERTRSIGAGSACVLQGRQRSGLLSAHAPLPSSRVDTVRQRPDLADSAATTTVTLGTRGRHLSGRLKKCQAAFASHFL